MPVDRAGHRWAQVALLGVLLPAWTVSGTAVTKTHTLGFDERVRAQEAIERVRYRHLIEATRSFEAAIPRSLLERKVRTYLKQSVALSEVWQTPITGKALAREWERIRRGSRFPQRLQEVYDALGRDPFLIQECFIRPVLAGRLARSFFAADERIHRDASETGRIEWDAWWAEVGDRFDENRAVPVATSGDDDLPSPWAVAVRGDAEEPCVPGDFWENGILDSVPYERHSHTTVWTGNEVIIWGGDPQGPGERYDPLTSTWTPVSRVNEPLAHYGHSAVWTGSRMIIWGWSAGAGYDPVSDTWTPVSTVNAPSPRVDHTAVWSGSEMIVWGGTTGTPTLNTGGRYNPATDSWTPTSLTLAPAGRTGHTAVWTGSEMIIWGGHPDGFTALNSGARYNPVTDAWAPMPAANAPSARGLHGAVWTGDRMIVWGGTVRQGVYPDLDTGGRYDPLADAWLPTSVAGAPEARNSTVAVWTGSEMVVWGGLVSYSDFDAPLGTGGRYDPETDQWTATTLTNAPSPRRTTGVWTGDKMIVWGGNPGQGQAGTHALNSGGRYDPASDTWTPTEAAGVPQARASNSVIWTGNDMIVWGGSTDTGTTDTGGRYDPLTDTWMPTSTTGAASPRGGHTAVWTGSEMIVWGGGSSGGVASTGGRYDPGTDSWTPMSRPVFTGVARQEHTTIWTGSEMIVWGGTRNYPTLTRAGGRYRPATDTWEPTSLTDAPTARRIHTAVWTGVEMIVWGGWGGADPPTSLDDGGRYDPVSDTWTAISTVGAPASRNSHAAVWSDSEMLVWGGYVGGSLSPTGGRYDPSTDSWQALSTLGAPAPRATFVSLWTGSEMLIWGGWLDTGGRYNPATDTWSPTATMNAPSSLILPKGVYTGSEMIVWGYRRGGRYVVGTSVDRDGDGHAVCAGDCDDADAAVWGTPSEVPDLAWTAAGMLTWVPPPEPGGSTVLYDMLRSTAPDDFAGTAICVATDDPLTTTTDPASPCVGTVFYYLVRAQSGCPVGGDGPLGWRSDGTPRLGPTCP